MTPAQAYGHPTFMDSFGPGGPTDKGLRGSDCRWAQNRLPAKPACVDCEGPIPMWTKTKLSPAGRNQFSGIGEAIAFGGVGVRGFAIGAAGDADIYAKMTPDQQAWVGATLSKLNDQIVKSTGTTCATWAPAIGPASGCFQLWYNATYGPPKGPANPLRTDGIFDADTLSALQGIIGSYKSDFPTPFPGVVPMTTPAVPTAPAAAAPIPAPAAAIPTAPAEQKKLSVGAMVGIGTAGAVVLGGIIYAATRKPKRR
jgi:hypothetical protein